MMEETVLSLQILSVDPCEVNNAKNEKQLLVTHPYFPYFLYVIPFPVVGFQQTKL